MAPSPPAIRLRLWEVAKNSKFLRKGNRLNQINVGCELEYATASPTSFLFQVNAAQTNRQSTINENLSITQGINVASLEIGLQGNKAQRCFVQPGSFSLHYEATVQLSPELGFANELNERHYNELPSEVLPYLNPSRYCESDLLGNFAFKQFSQSPLGLVRVRSICDWVFNNLSYVSGTTDSQTTAQDVFVQRQGVCRDYAHLSIALCRGLGIPARYVCGYAVNLQPADFHGFFEAYLGQDWYLFDATRMAIEGGLVRIATGHDAADVPFATFIGSALLKSKKVWANVPPGAPPLVPQPTQAATSTA
jgi:transglutaminase-like putative cysteine protease